jgi:hypothetical protein
MSQAVQGLQKGVRKLPDVWTEHPEIVRDLLREAGVTCGVQPRILQGRNPDWTCIVDGKNIGTCSPSSATPCLSTELQVAVLYQLIADAEQRQRRLPLSSRPSWGCSWEVGPGTSVGANRHLNEAVRPCTHRPDCRG